MRREMGGNWYFVLLLLLGCDNFIAPADSHLYNPPPIFATLWQEVESCSGRTGDLARIRWFETDGPIIAPDGREMAGVWHPPHDIYILTRWLAGGDHYRVVRHEMLHDLLRGDSDHRATAWTTCQLQ